jgi:hypothetical protein
VGLASPREHPVTEAITAAAVTDLPSAPISNFLSTGAKVHRESRPMKPEAG